MVSIGFRVSPSKVTYAIVRAATGTFALVDVAVVHVPPALETPRQLQYIRTTLLDILEEHAATRAGLRVAESTARRKVPFRLNLEGVVQELLASSNVERFVAGPIATMAALLGLRDRTLVKQLISGASRPAFCANWTELEEEEREAVLMAVAAANAGASGLMVTLSTGLSLAPP